ncbi:hypothetical protein [Enterococcus sp. RIT-PI-f]|uniref:hypothetical protein n=1 Tax=Enterococcus sp. RIT-PI-f TaxID=1690244 RepID=UPI0006B8A9F9|nr:hypothetical protein [Enterococcus sp. RIT-PI-f]KPG72122.1 hypothetical protein AEQ18_02495 [Enterococcus sp. RIT-PI-f]
MPLIAILIDFIGLFFYYIQIQNPAFYLAGLIIQSAIVCVLFILAFTYHGKKYAWTPPIGYRYFSIRFSILVISILINGIVLFLYILNYFGINDLIFSQI